MALIQPVEDGKIPKDTSTTSKSDTSNDLGYDQFLQLLCAEMQYQDPLEPTSNTEYVAQLATFSQMEATLGMQSTIESSNANALVGKCVIIKTTSSTGETTATEGFVDTDNARSMLRQHRTIASASLSRLFAPLLQFEKREIHTVFLRFPNFELGQKSWLSLLVKLCGVALIK